MIIRQARTQDFEKGGSGYHDTTRGRVRESFYTMDEDHKITETIDLSSPSFLDAFVKTFYKHYLYQFQSHS